ncbi:HAD family hydrolase [Streptococcus catagoni]|uniref:HAD family hydrolase n=1 Tax=Streptococcus catagoni TaxID=2654874 RepID=UPI00140CE03C|nr:HAD family phosphatase [Streptococcus catagoni]
MIKGIIFDMDGVLFDTEPFYIDRRGRFLDQVGISVQHMEAKDFIGGNLQGLWDKVLGQDFDKENAAEFHRSYEQYKDEHKAPYRDLLFPQVISSLQVFQKAGIRMALASNSNKKDVKRALACCQMEEYFDFYLAREDVRRAKPDPEIYLKAKEGLGLPKEELLVVEDSQKGIAAAKGANIQVYAIKDKRYGINQSQATKVIENLSQLQEELGLL